MSRANNSAVDLTSEFRLRRWARLHYVSAEQRDSAWHPVVLEEMSRKDAELAEQADSTSVGAMFVPLVPAHEYHLHGRHAQQSSPRLLQHHAVEHYVLG